MAAPNVLDMYALHPCLAGAVIAKQPELQPYVAGLRQLVSVPPDVYAELYLRTLYGFLELCQKLPDGHTPSQPSNEWVAYGLATHQLEVVIAALKLRRGSMLPLHSDSETIAEQEPLWTYALFSAGLLWQLARMQNQYCVELYKNSNERLGVWHPIAGNLAEANTHYKILMQAPNFVIGATSFQHLLVGRLIPTRGLRWLASCPAIFGLWWEVVNGAPRPSDNVLHTLLVTAKQRLTKPADEQRNTSGDSKVLEGQATSTSTLQKNARVPTFVAVDEETEKSKRKAAHEIQGAHEKKEINENSESSKPNPPSAQAEMVALLNGWLLQAANAPRVSDAHTDSSGLPLFFRVADGFFVSLTTLVSFLQMPGTKGSTHHYTLETLVQALAPVLKTPGNFSAPSANNPFTIAPFLWRYRPANFENRKVLEGIVLDETRLHEKLKAMPLQQSLISTTVVSLFA